MTPRAVCAAVFSERARSGNWSHGSTRRIFPHRSALFQTLFSELKRSEHERLTETRVSVDAVRNLAFFKAYFSNYIEGTEFELEEARDICFENKIPRERPVDAHDILGTFRVVSDLTTMRAIPDSEAWSRS